MEALDPRFTPIEHMAAGIRSALCAMQSAGLPHGPTLADVRGAAVALERRMNAALVAQSQIGGAAVVFESGEATEVVKLLSVMDILTAAAEMAAREHPELDPTTIKVGGVLDLRVTRAALADLLSARDKIKRASLLRMEALQLEPLGPTPPRAADAALDNAGGAA